MEEHIRDILRALGEDPDREGLQKTPQRVAQALSFLTRGYDMDPAKVINDALFTEDYEEMIVQKDIDFYSLCEHHLLPFFGKAHVAYIPAPQNRRHLQACPSGRHLCAAPAGPGAAHQSDCHDDHGKARCIGRRGGHRGGAPVHAHARRRKAKLLCDHQQLAWRFPHAAGHPPMNS